MVNDAGQIIECIIGRTIMFELTDNLLSAVLAERRGSFKSHSTMNAG